jgi:hypothetical protein
MVADDVSVTSPAHPDKRGQYWVFWGISVESAARNGLSGLRSAAIQHAYPVRQPEISAGVLSRRHAFVNCIDDRHSST